MTTATNKKQADKQNEIIFENDLFKIITNSISISIGLIGIIFLLAYIVLVIKSFMVSDISKGALLFVLFPILAWIWYCLPRLFDYVKGTEYGVEFSYAKGPIRRHVKKQISWQDLNVFEIDGDNNLLISSKSDNKVYKIAADALFCCQEIFNDKWWTIGSKCDIKTYTESIKYIRKNNAFSRFLVKERFVVSTRTAKQYFINRVCLLNPAARKSQDLIAWMEDCYIVGHNYPESDIHEVEGFNDALSLLKDYYKDFGDVGEIKAFITSLFQLAITDDGLKDDEWNYLLRIMTGLRFNKIWISYFDKRYNSIRTESEYDDTQSRKTTNYTFPPSLQTHLNFLGLSADATFSQLQSAYHKLAMEHHPDLPKNRNRVTECEAIMTRINEAYDILSKSMRT